MIKLRTRAEQRLTRRRIQFDPFYTSPASEHRTCRSGLPPSSENPWKRAYSTRYMHRTCCSTLYSAASKRLHIGKIAQVRLRGCIISGHVTHVVITRRSFVSNFTHVLWRSTSHSQALQPPRVTIGNFHGKTADNLGLSKLSLQLA